MEDDWTCGKGLAAHANLPRAMSELMESMATMLDRHTLALDPGQQTGRAEFAAYASLVAQHRAIARALAWLSEEMAGYDTLPMAGHDMDVLTSRELDAAFRAVVTAESAMMDSLRSVLDEHRVMLEMG